MRLLLVTRFHPAIGGLETVMEILAREWTTLGHDVRVATDVSPPAPYEQRSLPFEVHHRPGFRELLELTGWCDAYVQGCIGLKTLWPLCVYRRLYVATHQTWYRREDGSIGWQNHLKRWASTYAVNIAPSAQIASDLPVPCPVIPNPYRNDVFKHLPGVVRDRDLIFVGRLVSDKGANLLLQALAGLGCEGFRPSLTIVGSGPELSALERQTVHLSLGGQVVFTGAKSPAEVVGLLNRHRILVVPSVWDEPFGVVALEGIASGCLVVGSEGGGLKDAIGPCGLTFPNGDVNALTAQLRTALLMRDGMISREAIDAHLARHRPSTVAEAYIHVLLSATGV